MKNVIDIGELRRENLSFSGRRSKKLCKIVKLLETSATASQRELSASVSWHTRKAIEGAINELRDCARGRSWSRQAPSNLRGCSQSCAQLGAGCGTYRKPPQSELCPLRRAVYARLEQAQTARTERASEQCCGAWRSLRLQSG